MGYKDSTDARFLFKGQIVTDDTIDDSADIDASKLAATDSTHIFVATNGSDTGTGSIVRPYATLTKAFSVLTSARKTIFVMPGDYAEAATLTWPNIDGVRISGMDSHGNVVISAAGTSVISINPTGSIPEAFIENVCIEHTAQVGLQIDNAAMTRKIIVHLKGVSFSQVSTGNSIDIDHGLTTQAIRLYADECREIEGAVNIVPYNNDDRFRFNNCELTGGITLASHAVTAELALINCMILTSGISTGNAATVVTNSGSYYRTDAGVYSEFTNAYST